LHEDYLIWQVVNDIIKHWEKASAAGSYSICMICQGVAFDGAPIVHEGNCTVMVARELAQRRAINIEEDVDADVDGGRIPD